MAARRGPYKKRGTKRSATGPRRWPPLRPAHMASDRLKAAARRLGDLMLEVDVFAAESDARFAKDRRRCGTPRPVPESWHGRDRLMRRLSMPDKYDAVLNLSPAKALRTVLSSPRALQGRPHDPLLCGDAVVRPRALGVALGIHNLMTHAARAGFGTAPLGGRSPKETACNAWRVFAQLFLTDPELAEVQQELDGAHSVPRKSPVTAAAIAAWRRDMNARGWSL